MFWLKKKDLKTNDILEIIILLCWKIWENQHLKLQSQFKTEYASCIAS